MLNRVCAALALGLTLAAQTTPPPRLAPRNEVGLPPLQNYAPKDRATGSGQIWNILQDRRGLLYFGTTFGLWEYDGATWRKIRVKSSVVRSLAQDASGKIWAGENGAFGTLEPDAHGALQYVSLFDKIPAEHRLFTDVWQILPTAKGVFLRSYQKLFRWDGQRMQVWSSQTRFEALSEVRGRLYTSQGGIGLQEIVGDELRPVPGGDAYKTGVKLFLHPYDDRRMLISQRGGLLSLYDGEKMTPFPTPADEYLKKYDLYMSIVLQDGAICLTTTRGGAVILEHDGRLRRIIDQAGSGLGDVGVLSAFQDREGALWLGMGRGLARVDIQSPVSILPPTPPNGAARHRGEFYAAFASGGEPLKRLVTDPKTGAATLRTVPATFSQGFALLSLAEPPSNSLPPQLLFATANGVMIVEGDRIRPAIPGLEGPTQSVAGFQRSRNTPNRIYVSHQNGASSIRWEGGKWVDEGRLPGYTGGVGVGAEEADGHLWLTTRDGAVRVEVPPTGMRDAKMVPYGVKDGLEAGVGQLVGVGGEVFYVLRDGKNAHRWDPATGKFLVDNRFVLPIKDPVLTTFREITEGGQQGDVYSLSRSELEERQGVFRRQPDGRYQLEEEPYRGLAAFSVGPSMREPDGVFWFTVDGGVLRFDPRARKQAPPAFPALIRRVTSGSEEPLYEGFGPSAPSLPAERNSLLFEFAAAVFGNEDDTKYQYRLEGADRDWSAWGKQREARYNGLAPGTYRLRVKAKAADGRMSEEATYSFTILPPWYRTTWAYGLYAFLFGLATWGARQGVVRREREKSRAATLALEAQSKALEETVAVRTSELRAQAMEIAAQKDSIELLSDIGKEITASLDLDTILFKLYERVNQIVDASIFGVGLHRPEKKQIEYSLAIEKGQRYAPYTRSTEDKNQFAVWCIDHRRPILINDVATESTQYIPSYQHVGRPLADGSVAQAPASMIYLPLVAQDRVLGVLSVQSFKQNAYTEQHLTLLQNLASYTTIALDNAGAYRQLNEREHEISERARELATVNRITQALSSQLDRAGLIQLVGDQVRDVFHAQIAYVSLLDRATMMLHFPYLHGEDVASRPFGDGLTSQIIRSGQPLLINEDMVGSSSRLGVQNIGRRAASYLGVPIPSGGETIGVISVQTTEEEGRFNEADQRLLSTIASSVGVAFHNAKLFDEAREARASAEQADAAKSSFLSTVSHELRTPLTSVLGFAKIIRRRLEERLFPLIPEDDRKVQQAKTQVIDNLGVVVSEGERLTKLIDDVLDLAKIEAGKFTWNLETLSMADVVERALAATSSLFEAKRLPVVQDVQPGLPAIQGDRDRLIQVVINLISNAVKFTDAGAVTVSARLTGGELVVSVKDSGIGISAADQPKVFEKFKQVGDTLTDKPKGTGLGLPICKEIVEHHGGRIWVESTPGAGSTFSFALPLNSGGPLPSRTLDIESLVRKLRETVAIQQPRAQSILVVDDDPHIRSLLQQEFTEAGYTVRLAADGRQALAAVREEIPGLICLDVMMPEMNGFDVAAVLKNDPVTMDIPIIILSIVEDKERGFRLGVDRYLTKPIDTASLFREVGALLDQGKSHKKVMVVDEDASTIRTLTAALEARGYQVMESNGLDLTAKAIASQPDIIVLNTLLSGSESVRALRFEKGLENVLFLIYH